MPRGKKRGGFAPRGGRGGREATQQKGQPQQQGFVSRAHPHEVFGFTLADEARQTSQHDHSFWSSNNTLRHKPVAFVSAGMSDPLEDLDEVSPPNETDKPEDPDDMPQDPAEGMRLIHEAEDPPRTESEDEIIGPVELEQGIETSSGKDEPPLQTGFFFDVEKPQGNTSARHSPVLLPDRPSSPEVSSEDEVILFKGRDTSKKGVSNTSITLSQMHTEIQAVEEQLQDSTAKEKPMGKNTRIKNPNSQKTRQRKGHTTNDDDDLVADYIQNMRENGEIDAIFSSDTRNQRELGGPENVLLDTSTDDDQEEEGRGNINNNTKPDEAAAVPSTLEADIPHRPRRTANTDADPAYASESELDDETLARLIAGREDPIGPSLALVEDSSDSDSSSSDDKKRSQRAGQPTDDFDPMDWERPSLRRRKGKGARAQINFGVSDSELEQALQAAWSNDRLKKSQRKKQREELRALGQLGKGAGKPEDLRVKYPTGMNLDQIAEELKAFLLGSEQSLTLPPMDTHARKMIHDLASKFNIKSKSAGKADQRRPVLYRSNRTMSYVASTFDQAIGRIQRRYFPRLDNRGKRKPGSAPQRSGHTAATIQEGDIVGAAAPELGLENRGWAMMEKMGWSSGTALGATHNKGILEPVSQAIKKSKAGLG